jgi:pimeloyl-ACP methyl ester carboxylesterase
MAHSPGGWLIPGSELIVVAGSGHLPWHEQPGCLAAVLDRVVSLR